MTDSTKKGPAAKLREGMLHAEIWENQRDNGIQHNVTFSRSWRDQEGGWQQSSSFGERDLLGLGHLASRAHDMIRERQKELRQEAAQEPKRERTRQRDRDRER